MIRGCLMWEVLLARFGYRLHRRHRCHFPRSQVVEAIGDPLWRPARLLDGRIRGVTSITSFGRAWFTDGLVSHRGSIGSLSVTSRFGVWRAESASDTPDLEVTP